MFNKNEVIEKIRNKEDKLLVSNILDKYIKYINTNISTYSNFLDVRQFDLVKNILTKLKIIYNTYKAFELSEKVIIYFGEYEDYVTIYKIKCNNIMHKDVLGTLFSLGYDIDTIGDIIVNENEIYLTNLTRLNYFLETNLYMIKNKRISLEKVDEIIITGEKFINMTTIVSSFRIDTIVSKLANLSRSSAIKYINDKMVLLNYEEVNSLTKQVKIGDIISIRKVGKYLIDSVSKKSKKDNYILNIKKYR